MPSRKSCQQLSLAVSLAAVSFTLYLEDKCRHGDIAV